MRFTTPSRFYNDTTILDEKVSLRGVVKRIQTLSLSTGGGWWGGGGECVHLPLKRSLISGKASKQVMIVKVGASTNTSFDRQFSCSPRLKVLTRRRKGHTHIIVGAQKVCTYDKDDKKKFNVWLLAQNLSCLDCLSILLKHSSFLVARTPCLHENS